jgi:opacity protein-like surface antigen
MGFGASYSLSNDTILEVTYSGNTSKLKEKDHYSIYIAPSYQLSNNSLVYLKASYHKSEIHASVSYENENAQGIGKTSYTEDIDGYGFSIGLRSELAKNIFSDIEIEHIDYGSSNLDNSSYINWDNQSTVANFNLFYKF